MSEPMPATSPTLSPTLSAMTPGLRGSSSGMPASILPTRSAPTSALLVKMPPPTRENSATDEAPMPKPWMAWECSGSPPNSMYSVPMPIRPSAATARPMIEPPKNATVSASAAPCVCAAVVVRTLARVAVLMPM